MTGEATFLACVIELGETGSSLKPPRCDDTTSNHPNHFLLGFQAYALNSHTEQTSQRLAGHKDGSRAAGRERAKGRVGGQRQGWLGGRAVFGEVP